MEAFPEEKGSDKAWGRPGRISSSCRRSGGCVFPAFLPLCQGLFLKVTEPGLSLLLDSLTSCSPGCWVHGLLRSCALCGPGWFSTPATQRERVLGRALALPRLGPDPGSQRTPCCSCRNLAQDSTRKAPTRRNEDGSSYSNLTGESCLNFIMLLFLRRRKMYLKTLL